MNDQPGAVSESLPYESRDLDYRSLPGQSGLFLDFLYDNQRVETFYPNSTLPLAEFGREVLRDYEQDRKELCTALEVFNTRLGAGDETRENIRRLGNPDCVAVVTGQQAGLFGGPAYTIYKAVSAIVLANELTRSGTPAVPVFWIASEDHDLEEIRKAFIPETGGGLVELSCEIEGEGSKPVSAVLLGETVKGAVRLLESNLRDTPNKSAVIEVVRKCYRPEFTYPEGFGRLLTQILGRFGLVMVSPMEPAIRRLAAGFTEQIVGSSRSIREALLDRNTELESRGYHSQVLVPDDFFPFFLIDDAGDRVALRASGGDSVKTVDGKTEIKISSLIEALRKDPTILSPSALVRPLVQDSIFPTVCYFGGAAEVAYFAQNSAIYRALDRPVTPVRHRAAFTVVEPRNRRTMKAYGLKFEELFSDREVLMARVVEEHLNREAANRLGSAEAEIRTILDELEPTLRQSDPTLAESLLKRKKKILWHISVLRKKFTKAESLKDGVVARRLDYLIDSLFPGGALQERTLSPLHFLNEFGEGFVDWLVDSDPEQAAHKLMEF